MARLRSVPVGSEVAATQNPDESNRGRNRAGATLTTSASELVDFFVNGGVAFFW